MSREESPRLLAYLNHNKLCRPPRRPTIQRGRLLRQLGALCRCKLALIYGQAGCGKTTLFIDFLGGWSHPSVWYRLDKTDRDVTQFIAYLTEGIAQRFPNFGIEIRKRIEDGAEERAAAELPHLLLHETSKLNSGPILIVLDNFESVAPSQEVCTLVSDLLEYSGPDIHFAVTSRTMPSIPIARLLARQDVVLLGPEDLALTTDESRELLGLLSVHATDEQLDLLWRRTEGWAAGVVMIAEALQRSATDQVVASLEGLGGPPDMVYQYFANEVFEEQSEGLQQFLVETSILKRLAHDLVNELFEIDNGGDLLAGLRRGGVFTHGVEASDSDLRYHPLFRAFLLQKLHARHGDDYIHQLYRRAARAACRRQQWSDAVDYYAAVGDWQEVAELVERVGEELTRRGFLETVRHWLDLMPHEQILPRPSLLMLRGGLLRRVGRDREALRDLERALQGFQEQGNRVATVRTKFEAALAHHRVGEFRKAEAVLADAMSQTGDDLALRNQVLTGLSENCIALDDLEKAARYAELAMTDGASIYSEPANAAWLVRALRFHGRALALQGELGRGLDDITQSVELCRSADIGDYETSWSLYGLGQVLTLQGAFDQALPAFDKAEALAHTDRRRLHWICAWRGIACRDKGAFERAEQDLSRACTDFGLVGHSTQGELAFLKLRQGKVAEGLFLAEEALRSSLNQENAVERTERQAVFGIALAAAHDRREGLEQLVRAAEAFRQRGRTHQLASVRWHLARLLLGEGRRAEALEHLQAAALWASSQGAYNFWWWDAETVARLLPLALGAGLAPTYLLKLARMRFGPEDCRLLFSAVDTVTPALRPQLLETLHTVSNGSSPHGISPDPLQDCGDPTARQHIGGAIMSGILCAQDLAQLRGAAGLTWKEIEVFTLYYLRPDPEEPEGHFRSRLADSLALSEHTLKVHIRNIRRKLDIHHRRRGVSLPVAAITHRLRNA